MTEKLMLVFSLLIFNVLKSNSSSKNYVTEKTEAHWSVGDWGGCEPLSLDPASGDTEAVTCGWGLQSRNVTCVLFPSWPRQVTSNARCEGQAPPPGERLCAIRCGQDCQLGPWAAWTRCSGGCGQGLGGVTSRVRRVVTPPREGGARCPPRVQRRQCWGVRGRCGEQGDSPVSLPLTARNSHVSHVSRVPQSRHVTMYVGPWSNCSLPSDQEPSHGAVSRVVTRHSDVTRHVKTFTNPRQSLTSQLPAHPAPLSQSPGPDKFLSPAPHVGQMTREVRCRGERGESLAWSACMDGTRATVVPSDRQSCVMSRDCAVSEWSEWSEGSVQVYCDIRGQGERGETRTRSIVSWAMGGGRPCPHLEEEARPRAERLECKYRYQWKIGSWSECAIISSASQEAGLGSCGGGVMTRNLTCYDVSRGRPAHPNLCFELGDRRTEINLVKRCSIACTEPCNLSQWSHWSSCQPDSCYSDLNSLVKGFQIRTRQMVNKGGEESSCGPRDEIRSCRLESCFSWKIRNDGPCKLSDVQSSCGAGRQHRIIECAKWDGSPANSSAECDGHTRPRVSVECHVACPQDCITSAWSPWSRCPPLLCSSQRSHHHSRLPLRSRNRTVLAIAGPGGQSCPDTESLMEMAACPDTSPGSGACEWFSWRHGAWEECQLAPGYQCGKGLQTRKVYCQDNGGQIVPDWRCAKLRALDKRRACEVTCPRNCEVSGWTDWSRCPDMCQAGSSEGGALLMEIQRRERVVLVPGARGGQECPQVSQVRPCPLLAGSCRRAAWSPGTWSSCSLPRGLSCGQGLRARSLTCSRAGMTSLAIAECLETGEPLPAQSEACHVDCSEHTCELSAWSAWSSCDHLTCGQTRRRERRAIGQGDCGDTHLETVQEEDCPCDQFSARPLGPWSSCVVSGSSRSLGSVGAGPECGPGLRHRRVECSDSRGRLVTPELCGGDIYEEESCELECPLDCRLSQWSQWGLCDTVCGPGLRNRTSRVIQPPNRHGRPCPGPTVEYDTCDYTCDSFTWQATPWSQCSIGHGSCGLGSRRRTVRCVESIGDEPAVVLEKFCDTLARPTEEEDCYEPCPGHCVVSAWSSWSECEQCSWASRQTRNRTVLRSPDRVSSVCPPLEETRSCVANSSCWTFSWHLTPWTSCRPLGQSSCGPGEQRRGARCVRGDGRPVSRRECDHLEPPGDTLVTCSVDCPVDCQLSAWSDWASDLCLCGPGGRARNLTRSRHIVVPASATGRPCPASLTQTQPCPATPCYQWRPGAWSQCQLQGAACGTGVMTRNVSCVMADTDKLVPDSRCLKNLSSEQELVLELLEPEDLATERECYVSCHHDCTVSEWSQWSACSHQTCLPQLSVGVRARSRNVVQAPRQPHGKCSPQLEESGWCVAEPCYQYQWVVRDGDVFCQRSDGLRVDKGCKSRVVGCGPDCWSIPHTACAGGQCGCEAGHLAQADSRGHLVTCLPSTATNTSMVSGQARAEGDINIHYYPEIGILNYWMFAMITIACIFIVFVGVSIYILCQSTCRTEYRVPDYSLNNGRTVPGSKVVTPHMTLEHPHHHHHQQHHPQHQQHPPQPQQHPLPALWT